MRLYDINKSAMLVVLALGWNPAFADMAYTDNGGRIWGYTENNDGSIMITGVKMQSPSPLTIPNFLNGRHVTRIKDDAFRGNAMITGVTIPGCVVGIGDRAFADCANLKELTLLEGVKAIGGSDAFRWCPALKTVTLPKSLTFIRQRVFRNGGNIERVNVDSLESYLSIGFGTGTSTPLCGGKAYLYVNGIPIVDLNIPNGTKEIKACAFCGCHTFKNISIPGSVKRIGGHAFQNMQGTHMLFASDMDAVEIDGYAFDNSSSDCKIEVVSRPGYAFDGWEDAQGNFVADLLNQKQRIVVRPRWKAVGRRSYSQWRNEGVGSTDERDSSGSEDSSHGKGRPCWRCHGKGTVLKTVREICDNCNGAKVITTKVTLRKESLLSTRGCPKCNRTGSISVKREVECSTCHGTGGR